MDKILIKGGKPLLGTVEISGAKNAALPALAATLLTGDAVVLQNVPCVRDIQTTGQMLRDLGCDTDFRTLESTHSCRVSASNVPRVMHLMNVTNLRLRLFLELLARLAARSLARCCASVQDP